MKKEQSSQTISLRLNVDYPPRLLGGDISAATASFNIIATAVNDKYDGQQKRMDLPTLRKWGRIQDAMLDDDGKARDEATLTVEQHEWLLKMLKEANYPPTFAQAAPLFIDSLNGKQDG